MSKNQQTQQIVQVHGPKLQMIELSCIHYKITKLKMFKDIKQESKT